MPGHSFDSLKTTVCTDQKLRSYLKYYWRKFYQHIDCLKYEGTKLENTPQSEIDDVILDILFNCYPSPTVEEFLTLLASLMPNEGVPILNLKSKYEKLSLSPQAISTSQKGGVTFSELKDVMEQDEELICHLRDYFLKYYSHFEVFVFSYLNPKRKPKTSN